MKLSTETAVFKRVSLLIGRAKHVDWGGYPPLGAGPETASRQLNLYDLTSIVYHQYIHLDTKFNGANSGNYFVLNLNFKVGTRVDEVFWSVG